MGSNGRASFALTHRIVRHLFLGRESKWYVLSLYNAVLWLCMRGSIPSMLAIDPIILLSCDEVRFLPSCKTVRFITC